MINRQEEEKGLLFITGASGFLGSHLAIELAKRGYSIVGLIRPLNGLSGEERLRRIGRLLEADFRILSRISVVEGDMTLPELGLGKDLYHELSRSVTEIINCAADTSFAKKKREVVERINVYGLENLLKMATKSKCSFFHQISTAYVSEKTSGICKEELTSPKKFTNAYEETKCRAEHLSTNVCHKAGIRLNIYRAGIVCGESRKGRTFRFNGFYYPLKSIHRLVESFRTNLLEKDGEKARKMGVRFVEENRLMLPLTIRVTENAGINVIPVDYFSRMLIKIMDVGNQGGIFHITQEKNCPLKDLIEYTRKYFHIEGLNITLDGSPEGPIERIFNLYNEPYLPYLQDSRVFSSENTMQLRDEKLDDRFTYERFKICMDYAIKADWGKTFKG
ncbi:MAG: SDR family oxidoreductase [Deltaproteobacteria bacterium]|nr:SDR family oxidoreductase [Deltaproteobacteria bacterium]